MAVKQRIGSADPSTAEKFRIRVEAFIHHYVWGKQGVVGVGSHAAIAAGWSTSHARSQASNLLHNPAIKARILAEAALKEQELKAKSANVAEKLYEQGLDGNVPAATVFLRYAGKLKEHVELEAGKSLAELVLAASRPDAKDDDE